jgi:hypothetical protein
MDPLQNRPLSEAVDKQIELAKAEMLVGSARAYLYEVFEQVWTQVEAGEPLSMELRGRFRGAYTNAVLCCVQAVDVVHTAAGSTAIYASSALERSFRDIHTAATHANMRLATLADAGGLLLGVEPLPTLVRF